MKQGPTTTKKMRKIYVIWMTIFAVVFVTETKAQRAKLPDLIVSDAVITKDASGNFAQKISVTVKNVCGAAAGRSYVLVTFKVSGDKDAKAIYFIGNSVKPLKGGESFTQVFDLSDRKIGYGRYVYIEADPYKKVAEANEDNNWRTLFPSAAGNPASCTTVR